MRFAGLLQGKRLVDWDRQLARLDGAPKIGFHRIDNLRDFFLAPRPESDADIVDPPQRMEIEIKLALKAAEPADIDDPPRIASPSDCRS